MKKILVFVLALLMCGCVRLGTNEVEEVEEEIKTSIVKCTSEDKQDITFFSRNDEVYSMQVVFYRDFETLGVTDEMDLDTIKERVNNALSEKYADIKGVSAIGDIEDESIRYTIMIDFDAADTEQLIESGLLTSGEVQSQYISLKKTRESYQNEGFACSVQ